MRRSPIALLALLAAVTAGAAQDRPLLAQDISDDAIEIAIRSDFRHEGTIPEHRITVDCDDGIVVLTGEVGDLLARDRARELCERIRGVRAVVDDIDVAPRYHLADGEVARAVRTALLRDPATESFEVHCEVTDGAAVLSGEVDSHTERMLAVDVARSVQGVRSVDDQIDVKPAVMRPASEIRLDVEGRLENNVWVDSRPIQVDVDADGTVALSGKVGSAYERRLAGWLSWVDGARAVDTDGLEVSWAVRDWLERAEPARPASEAEIRSAVIAAFRQDPRLTGPLPSVEIDDGTVTLDGVVDNAVAREAARRDAESVAGVWRIRNFIRVRPAHVVEDREIARNVEAALRDTTAVDADEVLVEVDYGMVYLRGSVDSDWEKVRASDAARTADGVVGVSNLLLVEHPRATYAEGELADECERRMKWSPYIQSSHVMVDVAGTTLTLRGTVPTWRQRLEAARCARLAGAETVVNLLAIDPKPSRDDSGLDGSGVELPDDV